MVISKFFACTAAAAALVAATGCADGTGEALTPTLPTTTMTTNADGTRLKASVPQPLSPRSAIRVNTLTPALVIENSTTFNTNAQLTYVFQVFDEAELLVKSDPVAASGGQTTWTVPAGVLKQNKTYSWGAQASYNGVDGALSDGAFFKTPLPVVVEVAGAGAASGPGPVPCGGSSGPSIIACVAAAYPSRLAPRVSLSTRQHNMEFLRDRIIDTARCKGIDLTRNYKRGTPVISHDFAVLRQPGQKDRGIDLASGYDDTKVTLKLTWQVFGPDRNYGSPYYAPYPPVDCSGAQ